MTTADEQDLERLARYIREGSEAAFTELVHRHVDLVYSAALRQVRSPQLAEEVSQSVFTDLSRNARNLDPDTVLAAWLYQVARRTAIDVIRRESRRHAREQLALELADMNAHVHPSIWKEIEPLLEEAMERLEPAERTAILLRFFENRNLREVGETLGTSEDAAQKRVSRAVDRLREFLSQQGVTVGASGLVLALSANAVQSAPLGLATTISLSTGTAAAAGISSAALHAANASTTATATTLGTTKALVMTTLQKIAISATITVAVGVGLYENRRAALAREQLQVLQQSEAPLRDQVRRLAQEREDMTAQLAALHGQNEALRASVTDLPKLRGEVGRLRENAHELAQIKAAGTNSADDPSIDNAFKTWAVRAARLRQRFDQAQNMRIPELQFLTEKSWFDSVKDLKQLDTEEDFRKAFSNARNIAKGEFGQMLQQALRDYTRANNDQLPSDLAQLKPYFSQPVDDATLQRYKLLHTGSLNDLSHGDYLVADVAPLIDESHDATYQFSLNGTSSHIGDPVEDAVKAAGIQYAQAHNGLLPTDSTQLVPYLQKPLTPDQIQQVLSKLPPGITTLSQLEAMEK